jgi:carboxylesterase
MGQPAVLLVHGLGGTQYDLGSMHKRLKNAGFVTHSLTLPGHGTRPEDLARVRAEDWVDAVMTRYAEVEREHQELHLMGMCMGALLAAETAKRTGHGRKGKLVLLAPPIFIDGWATPWYRGMRKLLYQVPGLPARMRVEEEDPFGIKNEQLRAIVKAKFERGENFHYVWVPLACVREVDRLRSWVMKDLGKIACDTLVVHAREDELTSLRSADFLAQNINAGPVTRARVVVLENSYHMVAVDNDREIVARSVLDFFGVATAAMGGAVDDPKMSPAEQSDLASRALHALQAEGPAGLWSLGVPDFCWFQPGHNRSSGVFRGGKGAKRLAQWAGSIRFRAPGTPVHNAGLAVVPATLINSTPTAPGSTTIASSGVLSLAMRAGKLLEARWFPDDVSLEDAHFGGEPQTDGPSPAEIAFEQASRDVKTFPKAPDNDTLLQLYALYKQASVGDVTGDRPSIMDPVGRAKFDAWEALRGKPSAQAMAEYVALVSSLKSR